MKQKASLCYCINPQSAHILNVAWSSWQTSSKNFIVELEKDKERQQILSDMWNTFQIDETLKKRTLWLKKASEEDIMVLNKIRNSREKDTCCFSEYMEEMEISPCKIIG